MIAQSAVMMSPEERGPLTCCGPKANNCNHADQPAVFVNKVESWPTKLLLRQKNR